MKEANLRHSRQFKKSIECNYPSNEGVINLG